MRKAFPNLEFNNSIDGIEVLGLIPQIIKVI